MKKLDKLPTFTYHYFLDEAGDPSFYGKGKSIIIGTPGVSSCYFLGMIKFKNDLDTIRKEVVQLQQQVDKDPYFESIGSIEKRGASTGFISMQRTIYLKSECYSLNISTIWIVLLRQWSGEKFQVFI
jgi:hypothetical protein